MADATAPTDRTTETPARPARLVLVDLDPYLCHVVRQRFGMLVVTEVPADAELAWSLGHAEGPTVVLVDTSSPRLGQVLLVRRRVRVIGFASRDDDPWVTADLDAVLVRPFSADEVEDLVTRILASSDTTKRESEPRGPRWAVWMARHAGVAYLGALVLAAPLELTSGQGWRWLLLALLLAYATVRAWWRRPLAGAVDIGVTTGALLLTGGPASTYVPLAFAVTVHAGLGGSLVASTRAAAVMALSIVAVPPNWTELPHVAALASYLAVFPAIAATTAQSVRLATLRSQRDDPELASSRRVRDGVGEAHARARAGGAHVTVEDAAHAILDDVIALGGRAAVVLLAGPGGLLEVASAGLLPHPPVLLAQDALADAGQERPRRLHGPPDGIADQDGVALDWYGLALRDTGAAGGRLVFGLPTGSPVPDTAACEQLGRRGAVLLATAQTLVRLRELATDRERLELATQLQDDVAQALVHVRMELELLADGCDDGLAFDLQRLVTVVQRNLAQVQATVADLRSTTMPIGLGAALRQYARDLATVGGPSIRVTSRTRLRLGQDIEQGVFEIARTAIADAHRHVGVTRIAVVVDELDANLRVSIEHDGLPLHEQAATQHQLDGRLRSRAASIGATLHTLSTPERGSRMEILCRDPDSYLVMP